MVKQELIKEFELQLDQKSQELETKLSELKVEYNTQKYINELLVLARKDINSLAEYLTVVNDNEKALCLSIIKNFISTEEEINHIFQEAKNLYNMKKRNFDTKGVPQYTKSKLVMERFLRRINEYNLTRNFKYISLSQINELSSYLNRVKDMKLNFKDGKLINELTDIDEVEYIIEKSTLPEEEKTDILYSIYEANNKFFNMEEEGDINVG